MLPAEKKASVLAGTWNSIQGSKPGLGQPNDGALPGWYETDLYAGASIELDKRWTVSETCYRYVSPSACVSRGKRSAVVSDESRISPSLGSAGISSLNAAP